MATPVFQPSKETTGDTRTFAQTFDYAAPKKFDISAEFQKFLKDGLSIKEVDDGLEKIFTAADKDKSGALSRKEFVTALDNFDFGKGLKQKLTQSFDEHAVDGNLSHEGFVKMKNEALDLLKSQDKNRDGIVKADEVELPLDKVLVGAKEAVEAAKPSIDMIARIFERPEIATKFNEAVADLPNKIKAADKDKSGTLSVKEMNDLVIELSPKLSDISSKPSAIPKSSGGAIELGH